ncbi:Ku protein [Streptomyces sp. NPDC000880]
MPSLLSTAISFGLVTIPVSVVPATESHSVAFRQIHLTDLGRVRNRKICEVCGQQLGQDEIGRGWELPAGSFAVPVVPPGRRRSAAMWTRLRRGGLPRRYAVGGATWPGTVRARS